MRLINHYKLWEWHTGIGHDITILASDTVGEYQVRVDGEFYATAESRAEALEEATDIVIDNNWTNIRPL